MTVSYGGVNNYFYSPFSIETPVSIEGGILRAPKCSTEENSSKNEGNKILDFKTGEYVDYGEYLLKNESFDIKYFA